MSRPCEKHGTRARCLARHAWMRSLQRSTTDRRTGDRATAAPHAASAAHQVGNSQRLSPCCTSVGRCQNRPFFTMSKRTRDSRSQEGPTVITSRLPPSRFLGSVATTVCCPCLVTLHRPSSSVRVPGRVEANSGTPVTVGSTMVPITRLKFGCEVAVRILESST